MFLTFDCDVTVPWAYLLVTVPGPYLWLCRVSCLWLCHVSCLWRDCDMSLLVTVPCFLLVTVSRAYLWLLSDSCLWLCHELTCDCWVILACDCFMSLLVTVEWFLPATVSRAYLWLYHVSSLWLCHVSCLWLCHFSYLWLCQRGRCISAKSKWEIPFKKIKLAHVLTTGHWQTMSRYSRNTLAGITGITITWLAYCRLSSAARLFPQFLFFQVAACQCLLKVKMFSKPSQKTQSVTQFFCITSCRRSSSVQSEDCDDSCFCPVTDLQRK